MSSLTRATTDADPLVAETAATAVASAGRDHGAATTRYSTIDKVLILKEVSLFKAIPHETLAAFAALLAERWVAAGERIFAKGELGDCLYVVASGRVRIHDGDSTFKVRCARDFFGELSLLDAKPRSASASALEPTYLLRLDQTDFYSLLSEQSEIAHAINRALCQMVRSANASLASSAKGLS
jgi:CRP-like cAMP-binding protein